MKNPPIPQLTGIRFFLSLWVILYHLTVPNPLVVEIPGTINSFVYHGVRTAYSAVSLFFMISGFSLAYNYELDRPWSRSALKKYALTRFTRIYPIFLLGLAFMLPVEIHQVCFAGLSLAREAGSGLLNLGMVQSWLPQTALSWNPPGWSLSDEVFFYACFPFLGVLLRRAPGPGRRLELGLGLWMLAMVAPLAAVALPAHGFGDVPATSFLYEANPVVTGFVKFNPVLRLPDFCIGVLLGRQFAALRQSGHPLLGRGPWFYLPGLAALAAALAFAHRVPYPLFHNVLTVPFCALIGPAWAGRPGCCFIHSWSLVFPV
jgi:peptidoglycan/LPS O-acetylase OafA/YrhL